MTTDSQPSEQAKPTAIVRFRQVREARPGPDPLSPEEREEWKRNSPSSAKASRRRAEPPTTV